MPEGCGDTVVAFKVECGVGVFVDEVEFGVAFGVTRGRVDVESTEMAAPFEVKVGASVDEFLLIAENDESPSGNLSWHHARKGEAAGRV